MRFQQFAVVAAAASGLLMAASPAAADPPQRIGLFKSWSTFTSGSGDARVCYALSTPKRTEPTRTRRDAVYFLINDWPGRHVRSEPEIVPGYEYKDGSKVTVYVGSEKFEFFTRNEGGAGGAWVEQQADETRLVDAMRHGAEVIVKGVSKKGTTTRDTYSLAGINEALDKAHETCGP